MTLDYEMEKTPAGWKIYDVKVAGVRLVTTYREVFAEKVRDGGVDGLIQIPRRRQPRRQLEIQFRQGLVLGKVPALYAIFQNMFRGGRQ